MYLVLEPCLGSVESDIRHSNLPLSSQIHQVDREMPQTMSDGAGEDLDVSQIGHMSLVTRLASHSCIRERLSSRR